LETLPLTRKRFATLDGYTPEQRFFLALAQIWAGHQRPEAERLRVATNPAAVAQVGGGHGREQDVDSQDLQTGGGGLQRRQIGDRGDAVELRPERIETAGLDGGFVHAARVEGADLSLHALGRRAGPRRGGGEEVTQDLTVARAALGQAFPP
jgi:hypothetical protein